MSRSDAAADSRRVDPPAWMLLDTQAVLSDRRNATTASARTSTGGAIQVTFFAADPPRDSYFCVHCHGLREYSSPWILYSQGDLALLRVELLAAGPRHTTTTDYFVYRAGRLPSLQLLGDLCGNDAQTIIYNNAPIGLLPLGGDGEHFALAALVSNSLFGTYELHVFRSDRGTWTSTTAELGTQVCLGSLEKVIALGGGDLGWVDLRKGILVCDVLGESPKPRVIPMPTLLPTNRFNLWRRRQCYPREYRDVVVCADGSIRCVELERHLRRVLPEMHDASSADVLHDSDLPMGIYSDDDRSPSVLYEYLGWRVIVWSRTASSTCWRKERLVHVDDILANDPGHASLLRETIGGGDGGGGGPPLTVKSLLMEMDVPSLGIDGGDFVYIMSSKVKYEDTKSWAIAVDMRRKTLVGVAPVSIERHASLMPNYLSCGLSRYLQMD